MKRNKLKQMYYKDENTFGYWKDLNGNPTKEYTKWVENKLMEQLNLYAVSEPFYCGLVKRQEGKRCISQCGGCEDKEARGKQ